MADFITGGNMFTTSVIPLAKGFMLVRTHDIGKDHAQEAKQPSMKSAKVDPMSVEWFEVQDGSDGAMKYGAMKYITQGGFVLTGFRKLANDRFQSLYGNFSIEIKDFYRLDLGLKNGNTLEHIAMHDQADVKINGIKMGQSHTFAGQINEAAHCSLNNMISSVQRIDASEDGGFIVASTWSHDMPCIGSQTVRGKVSANGHVEEITEIKTGSYSNSVSYIKEPEPILNLEAERVYGSLFSDGVAPGKGESLVLSNGALLMQRVDGNNGRYYPIYKGYRSEFVLPPKKEEITFYNV